ncbi:MULTISPECIES: outer membrane lipoprotein-sorting protein [Enterobacteriaceae]|nr:MULTISPECIES: outer membrane lipoprotein-sorting protein [Klebsiella]EHT04843.1 hypothetical protein HMPREF9694_05588 [Klebsiella michiganensis]MCW9547285.1 outer membrane lipoprotein-sorting protein [Klebsiella oxytoca]VUS46933.1 hypothetical protein SPARK1531C2_05479 [Klebsiella grimontii]
MKYKIYSLLFCLFSASALATPQADEILVKVRDRYDGDDYVSQVTLRNNSNGNIQDKNMYMLQKDFPDREMVSMFFHSPSDVRNVSFLVANYNESIASDDEQWMYLPAFRKVRRISGQDKRGAFMGSAYSYSDLDKLRVKDYQSTLEGEDKVNGRDSWKIERIPVSQDVINKNGYNRTVLWVDKERDIVLKQDYYNSKNVRYKSLEATEVRLIQDIWTITHSKMKNFENDKESEMIFHAIKYNAGVDVDYLTQNILKTSIKDSEFKKLIGQ